jgi:hypothetical protein
MNHKQTALLLAAALGTLCLSVVLWNRQAADRAVRVEFVSLTNVPGRGPQALLKITNLTSHEIAAQDYGYLGAGESGVLRYGVPGGTGPWRASVRWRRQDLSRLEERVNGWHDQLLDALDGSHMHRDSWLPFWQVSRSPDIQR